MPVAWWQLSGYPPADPKACGLSSRPHQRQHMMSVNLIIASRFHPAGREVYHELERHCRPEGLQAPRLVETRV